MPDLGFQSGHFGIGVEQGALGVMHAVAAGKVGFARFLKPGFGFAQRGILRFQVDDRAFDFARKAFAFSLRVVAPQQPEQLLLARQFVVVFAILPRDRRLPFESLHLRTEFDPYVLDAREIFAGIGDSVFGFLAPFLVFRDAGRFFEEHAQFVGFRLDDAGNRSLADDGVGARTEAGAEKQVGDVLAANVQIVDVVLGLAGARQQALHRQLGILRPLAGNPSKRVVEDEFDRRPRHRFAPARAIEDHVLHRFAAQLRCL